MKMPVLAGLCARARRRALPSRVSSLILLLQRSPLVKILMPEARVISSSGMADVVKWCVTAIAGLGAFDSVTGATAVVQVSPTAGSSTVNFTAGAPLTFLYQMTGGGGHIPATFTIFSGTLPTGLTRADIKNSTTDYIFGSPTQTGTFPITLRAWEGAGGTGRYAAGSFNLVVSAPPSPTITAHPAGTTTTAGSFVKLSVSHTNGQTFTWKKNGTALPASAVSIVPLNYPRKWFIPTADPGTAWRTDAAFVETGWTAANGGIGYDTSTTVDYNTLIASPGGTTPSSKGFANIRIPFTMTNTSPLSYLKLRYKCDDGFVMWLNGTEIGRINAPSSLLWNSSAASSTVDSEVFGTWRELSISSQFVSLLHQGTNLLAIQLLNSSATSNDMLMTCELIGGIDSANSPTLVLPALSLAETGSYSVSVNNFSVPAGVPSNPAPVHILPAVANSPQGVSINAGQTAQLSVTATGSSLNYQWYQGNAGDTSNPVSGATNPTFTTPALSSTTTYWVRVSNPGGTADSTAATVTVVALPPSITTQPQGATVNYNQSTRLSVSAGGTGPFTYQWYQGNAPDTTIPVTGATADTFDTPLLTTTASYWVRVTNSSGFANSNTAIVTVLAQPPSITTQPAGAAINYNQSITLTVAAGGTAPFTYQWYQGSGGTTLNPVPGATAPSFTTPALNTTTAFWVRVSNPGGSTDSLSAIITVIDNIDAWRAAVFSASQLQDPSVSGPSADPDRDGLSNETEYVMGSLPLESNPPVSLNAKQNGGKLVLSFPSHGITSNPGYRNRQRLYTIETISNLTGGTWVPVAGAANIPATGSTISREIDRPAAANQFYRLRVTLGQ